MRGCEAIPRARALAEGFAREAREAIAWLPARPGLPVGTRSSRASTLVTRRTRSAVDKVSAILEEDPAVELVTALTGYSILNGAMASNGGTLFVVLKHWDERPDTVKV